MNKIQWIWPEKINADTNAFPFMDIRFSHGGN